MNYLTITKVNILLWLIIIPLYYYYRYNKWKSEDNAIKMKIFTILSILLSLLFISLIIDIYLIFFYKGK